MKKILNKIVSVFLVAFLISSTTIATPVVVEAATTVKVSCSSSVAKNSINTIKVTGKKNTTYYIKIKCPKGSWSTSKTVTNSNKHKKTNSKGVATWDFKVGGGSTSKGTYKIHIYSDKSCKNQVASKSFKVK